MKEGVWTPPVNGSSTRPIRLAGTGNGDHSSSWATLAVPLR
jgi:hypothetical protein